MAGIAPLHLLALASAATTPLSNSSWEAWKAAHGRSYATIAEETRRHALFDASIKSAAEMQAMNPIARFGPTKFADRAIEELSPAFLSAGNGSWPGQTNGDPNTTIAETFDDNEVTTAEAGWVDWRERGAVTPVKNQYSCGGCWAFSAIAALEGQWFLAGNPLTSLSEQEIVSCASKGNGSVDLKGCNGGEPYEAIEWVVRHGGVNSEVAYPFANHGYGYCSKEKAGAAVAHFSGTVLVPAQPEGQLLAYMSKYGPVSIGVCMGSLTTYVGGIITKGSQCAINHAVAIVGYGHSDSTPPTPYWIVKNSWGADWGEEGYFRAQYDTNALNMRESHPVGAKVSAAHHHPTEPPAPVPPPLATPAPTAQKCIVHSNIAYGQPPYYQPTEAAVSPSQCCLACSTDDKCRAFVFRTVSIAGSMCFLANNTEVNPNWKGSNTHSGCKDDKCQSS